VEFCLLIPFCSFPPPVTFIPLLVVNSFNKTVPDLDSEAGGRHFALTRPVELALSFSVVKGAFDSVLRLLGAPFLRIPTPCVRPCPPVRGMVGTELSEQRRRFLLPFCPQRRAFLCAVPQRGQHVGTLSSRFREGHPLSF